MKYQVLKPFHDQPSGEIVALHSELTVADESRAKDLLRLRLIGPLGDVKNIKEAPSNKDAAKLRKTK